MFRYEVGGCAAQEGGVQQLTARCPPVGKRGLSRGRSLPRDMLEPMQTTHTLMLPAWHQVRTLSPVVASSSGGSGSSAAVAEVTVMTCAPTGSIIAAGYSDGTVRGRAVTHSG